VNQLRRQRPSDQRHLDEVSLTSESARHNLWRAVDRPSYLLDTLVQCRRNEEAAKKFFRKLSKGLTYIPRVPIMDTLKSYGAAKQEIVPGVDTGSTVSSTTAQGIST